MTNFVPGGSRDVQGEAFRKKERRDTLACAKREGRALASLHNNVEFIPKDNLNFMGDTTPGIDPGKNDDVGQAIADFDRVRNPTKAV